MPGSSRRGGTIRVLAVSDEESCARPADAGRLRTAELILACGDLSAEYLGQLMDALDRPLVFIPGNHDPDLSGYRVSRAGLTLRAGLPARPPWPDGAVNADGRVVEIAGLRVAGLGGCLRYGGGPNQYTERQQARRSRALRRRARWRALRDGRGIDVLLTHAPPRGIGDGDDIAHRGFRCYHGLIAALRPAALLHGHVHRPGASSASRRVGGTAVRNVMGLHLLDLPVAAGQPGSRRAPSGRPPGSARTAGS
jgi:hypothetical protein